MFSNIHISENFLRNRELLSLQNINAARSFIKKEFENKDNVLLAQAKKKKKYEKCSFDFCRQKKNDTNFYLRSKSTSFPFLASEFQDF